MIETTVPKVAKHPLERAADPPRRPERCAVVLRGHEGNRLVAGNDRTGSALRVDQSQPGSVAEVVVGIVGSTDPLVTIWKIGSSKPYSNTESEICKLSISSLHQVWLNTNNNSFVEADRRRIEVCRY